MDIQLKQQDIEKAIRLYIGEQGITTRNKDITMSFTAGRKKSGITADVSIEDVVENVKPVSPITAAIDAIQAETPKVVYAEVAVGHPVEPVHVPLAQAEAKLVVTPTETEVQADPEPVKATSSIFAK